LVYAGSITLTCQSNFHCRVRNSPQLFPVCNQANPIHTHTVIYP